jgi:hypothetical protein
MKKRGLVIMGLLAIGAVFVLCSCGGGGDKRLTKEQFAAKANALCVSFSKADKEAGNPSSVAEAITYFEKLTPLYEKRVAALDKLKPPADEEATVNKIVSFEKNETSLAKQLLAALKKNDTTKANKLIASGNSNSGKATALYKQLGITECAKSS